MKPFFLGLCLFSSATLAFAQPPVANPVANPFSPFTDAPVASRSQKVSLAQLSQNGGLALLSLRQPLNGAKQAMAVAWGRDAVLLSMDGAFQLMSLAEVKALYGGEATVPVVPKPILQVDNAVRVVPITSLGEDAEILAQYTLRNSGSIPLDVSVASTSCGCTSAKLEKNHLEAGESTKLTATMHTDSERLVSVTLSTNDAAQPRTMVALQSKRTFTPFQAPSPLSLFGEKGQSISSKTDFELPLGWKVTRVSASPAWLQTQLQPQAASSRPDVKIPALPRFSLTATAPDSAPEGTLQGQVRLDLVGAPLKFLSVLVGGFISNDISASPRMVVLNGLPTGLARRVVVVHGPRPFSIRAITSPLAGFQARFEPTIEAKAHAVELLMPVAGEKGESFFERVSVELSDGRELPLDIAGTVGEGTLPAIAQGVVLNAPAPNLSGTSADGKAVSLADFKGRSNVLLTFFPHCFTGGCESHLASLRDAGQALTVTRTQVVAVSTDDAAQIRAFATQLKLPFSVLSDTSRQIALSYGAVQTATEAPSRLSFLIDKNGIVRYIDTDVHVLTHGADMLAKIHELGLDRKAD
jgi:peroxiredoxin Q/BCP